MATLRYALTRVLSGLGVLLVVAFVTFAVFYLLPSDPAQLSCGRPCTPESLALAKGFMGLDHPWYQQFVEFVTGIVTGRTFGSGATAVVCPAPCFGYSFQQTAPVASLIADRLPVTVSLALGAAVLWLVVGVALGVVAALRRGRAADHVLSGLSVIGVSAPVYLLGLLGILLLGFTLDVVPVSGYVPLSSSPLDWAWHLALPWAVLACINGAVYVRLARGQMLEVLSEDYIRTARAKGLPERTVVGKHALRNVTLPLVTLFGLDLGGLLGGAVITEKTFGMPGVGSLLLDAVGQLDLPLLLGTTLFAAVLIVLANIVVDLVYGLLDPRARIA
ncbi:ABC transporter permease [Kineococcus rhizosphaerae]|uniref:Peptide/nickel transport system permease protein n=1 Tax=Kineococcus rhizosphaerae TaxID=559628 RepID=A0A2T0R7S1_9ACTN|nr:ABC transporter permease [Kineococcus rhizosphaerae]PRY17184.1 peptide/nickel transport system permease protein [Kineococcus rhizosphaerae]